MSKRQQFLSDERLSNFFNVKESDLEFAKENLFEADSPEQEKSLRARYFQELALDEILVRYTAGDAIDSLALLLEKLVEQYQDSQKALATYENSPNIPPLDLGLLYEYEECVQVISLCILLHRIDLLAPFVAMFDNAGYAGDDTLYEDLLSKVLPNRHDVDEWNHETYTPLVHAIYEEDGEEASALLEEYCNNWYPAFEQAPWHDTHLMGDKGSYVGYWALEAGAIAYLYGIDDRAIEHMVYPKDLVDYARNFVTTNPTSVPRIEAGQPCKKTGYWFTPAQTNSRRYFKQGEIMPSISDSRWGDTLWYWSGE
ncbi:PoNe immunity protein domain-containing protein [Pseudomonas sp. BF-B-26]|jgi:hypothetical protein|uniref:PoNe immunity protein domain-containing protein n=1 Tax=Pseudomonas sp. BF-B-26 TaxID=2832400 RepID=UPI001CBC3A9F|nr:PoNe immunity protein domain-containing protein [Pseudomonas sp. BF-B-26]